MTRAPQAVPQTVEAQAADWLALARSGRMTPAQTADLEAWLAADVEHRLAYQSMQDTWRLFGDLEDDPAVMEVREWATRAYNRPVQYRFAAAIAAAAVLAGGWWSWWASTPAPLPPEIVAAATENPAQAISTGLGQTTTATLFDGSVVTLDTDSALVAREVGGIRLIELKKGRAFFKVAHDTTRPFKVLAAGRTVTATGTQFSVRAEPGAYQVTLVEGSVTVESPRGRFLPGQEKKLTPGLSLLADAGGRLDVEKINVVADTSWRTGRLTFQDEPLGQAAAEMNRYSKRKLVVDPAVAATPILGVFPNGDVEAFARAAEATQIASVRAMDDTRIELAPPSRNSGEANVHNFESAPSS
jgi:transmembrane sensor